MKSIILNENKEFEIISTDIPHIEDDDVLVKVEYCGICGSDLSRYYDQAKYYPIVLGHEFSGTIVNCGKNSLYEVGNKVVCAPLRPCFECSDCLAGNYFACKNYKFMGSGRDGAFQQYITINQRNIILLPEEIEMKDAAFVEPLAVGLHAIDRLDINQLDNIAVIGCGTIGLMIIQSLKARGVFNVVGIDISEDKLEMAKKLGADKVSKTYDNDLFDVIFECTGVNIVQQAIINNVTPRGRICYVGTAHGDIKFSAIEFEKILRNEIIVTGSWMSYSHPFPGTEWETAVKLISSKKVVVDKLITIKEPNNIAEGFDLMKSGEAYKVMIDLGFADE